MNDDLSLDALNEPPQHIERPKIIPEKWYKDWIRDVFNAAGWTHFCTGAGALGGESGIPDRIAVEPETGRFYAVEAKRAIYKKGYANASPSWVADTPRGNQAKMHERLRRSRAIVRVVGDEISCLNLLEDVMEHSEGISKEVAEKLRNRVYIRHQIK